MRLLDRSCDGRVEFSFSIISLIILPEQTSKHKPQTLIHHCFHLNLSEEPEEIDEDHFQEDAQRFDDAKADSYSSDEEQQEQRSKSPPESILHKKKVRQSKGSDEEFTRARKPLSDSFHQNRQDQRAKNHPTNAKMVGTRSGKHVEPTKNGTTSEKAAAAAKSASKPKTKLQLPAQKSKSHHRHDDHSDDESVGSQNKYNHSANGNLKDDREYGSDSTHSGSKRKGSGTSERRTSTGRTNKHKRRKPESDDEDEDYDEVRPHDEDRSQIRPRLVANIQEYRQELAVARARNEVLAPGSGTKAAKSPETAMDKLVVKKTKQWLFKKLKFIRNMAELKEETRWLMEKMDPVQIHLQGLEGEALALAQDIWVENNAHLIRKGINELRNYIQGETKKLYCETVFKLSMEEQDKFPKVDHILALMKREGLLEDSGVPPEELKRNQDRFDNFVDLIVPKAAGNHAFPPAIRHVYPMSEAMTPRDANMEPVPSVSRSDMAFLAVCYLNYYDSWVWDFKKKNGLLKQVGGAVCYIDARGKKVYHEPKPATPYTSAEKGYAPFGGWNAAGRKKFKELKAEFKAMLDDPDASARILQADEECLERLRALHKVPEAEAKRANRGRR